VTRRVAITGATGFLGWHASEAFRDEGWQVRAIVRQGSQKAVPPGADRAEAALDVSSLRAAFHGCEAVVHAAGIARAGDAALFTRVNVEGTQAVAAAAAAAGARLVYISSQAAIGPGTAARPAREHDAPHPVTAYGRSKLAAERAVAEAGGTWTIVRPASVYGPRDRQFLPLFRLAARGWFPLAAARDAAFTLIHVDDVSRALVTAAAHPGAVGQAFFLGHPDPQREVDLLPRIAEALGRRYRPLRIPRPVLTLAARAGDIAWHLGREPLVDRWRLIELTGEGFVCAIDHAAATIDFRARVALPEGIAQTVRWYREEGWI
jgi:nucleoside-diphosphate-sugar epimerase